MGHLTVSALIGFVKSTGSKSDIAACRDLGIGRAPRDRVVRIFNPFPNLAERAARIDVPLPKGRKVILLL
jgi:hypothetical protein